MSDSNHPSGEPDDNDEPSTSAHSPRLMPPDEIPDGTPGELLRASQSNGDDDNQSNQPPAPVAATNFPDDLEEEMIFAMSPHEENGPSAPGAGSSNVPTTDTHQAMPLRLHNQRQLTPAVADIRRSEPSARDIVPRAVPTQAYVPAHVPAHVPALARTLGGDGTADTAGIHPSECPEGRGTKKKGSWNFLAELWERMQSKKKKSKDESKGPKKEDEQ
ncbi:hypothetical protein BDZ45DRAFT_683580 [Acephala macrosclerotiorum]|nr:hypothetical protein BDZ45DRAFT_683580 [Acephala macrosclerotiorum]